MYEIFVNGTPRTHRDIETVAVDAGRVLKHRDMSAEIRVVCCETKRWAPIIDAYAVVVWKESRPLKVAPQTSE